MYIIASAFVLFFYRKMLQNFQDRSLITRGEGRWLWFSNKSSNRNCSPRMNFIWKLYLPSQLSSNFILKIYPLFWPNLNNEFFSPLFLHKKYLYIWAVHAYNSLRYIPALQLIEVIVAYRDVVDANEIIIHSFIYACVY